MLSALGEAAVEEKKKGTDLETIVAEHRPKPKKLAKKESVGFILSINFENGFFDGVSRFLITENNEKWKLVIVRVITLYFSLTNSSVEITL